MTWKSYAAASGAGLLATYLFSTPTVVPQRPSPPRATAVTRPVETAVDIRDEAARLQARPRDDVEYREPSRNPFRFAARPAPPRAAPGAAEPASPIAPPDDPVPPPPLVRLTGIATSIVDGVSEREAILVTEQGVLRVREGDAVGAVYRVTRIDADGIELVANDGTSRRIRLRP